MIIDIIEYQLKDGRTARIRSPKDEDIQEMLDFLYVSAGETDFLMRCPEECGRYTTESEKQRFDRVNKADNETILLCFVDGKLVGSGQITVSYTHLDVYKRQGPIIRPAISSYPFQIP